MAVMCSITFGIATTLQIEGIAYLALIPAALALGFPRRAVAPVAAA